jgi:hypothetical protein
VTKGNDMKCICPVCMHAEAMRARNNAREPCFDDMALMRWQPPRGGAGGKQCHPNDRGVWRCQICDFCAAPEAVGVLLDAVMYFSFPECDSIGSLGLHEDTRIAFKGGRRT